MAIWKCRVEKKVWCLTQNQRTVIDAILWGRGQVWWHSYLRRHLPTKVWKMGFKQGPCLTENIHQIIVPQSCHRQQMDQFRYQDYHHETSGSIPSARPGPSHWVSGGKHFQFREKLRSVTVFWREEKSGLNFSAAPSQLDSEEASKHFSREVDILVVEFYSQQSRHIPSSSCYRFSQVFFCQKSGQFRLPTSELPTRGNVSSVLREFNRLLKVPRIFFASPGG